jgi:outer membrane protein assembly factor BamE (lipoprotein component of BamABCDE complex)
MNRFILLLVIILSGCVSANYGNQNLSIELVKNNLVAGKTTKNEVIQFLGQPSTVSVFANGQVLPKPGVKEQLSYVRMTQRGVAEIDMTIVTVFLDDNGIVLDYVVTQQQNNYEKRDL